MSQVAELPPGSSVPNTKIVKVENSSDSGMLSGLSNLPTIKQIGLMLGLSASIALGVTLVLWTKDPEMRPLGRYSHAELVQVIEYLESNKIAYRMESNGSIMIDRNRYQQARLGMTSEGITTATDPADEILNKDTGFGVSEKLESARLLRSREKSLARTIEQFSGVSAAQVHLAVPKAGVFVRDTRKPSAAVMLNVRGYDTLDDEQVRAIVNLVAGSVPELSAKAVTITDQYGRLHHSGSMSEAESENRKKFSAEQKKQAELKRKIEEVLIPLVGPGKYTVQVNVDLDFSKREQTRKSFNNDLPSVRSERTIDDYRTSAGAMGIPGALSNQPPADAEAPQQVGGNEAASEQEDAVGNRRVERERNYDLDTTISYTKNQVGALQRISVAVGLDFITNPDYAPPAAQAADTTDTAAEVGATGEQQAAAEQAAAQQAAVDPNTLKEKIPRPDEEIANIRRLIQGVVGYSPARGDSVEVISFPFVQPEPIIVPQPSAFYETPLFDRLLKPLVMLLGIMFLIFGLFRPIMKKLATPTVEEGELAVAEKVEADTIKVDIPEPSPDEVTISHDFEALGLPEPAIESAAQIKQAQSIATDNSHLVAQVVRNWMEEDGG